MPKRIGELKLYDVQELAGLLVLVGCVVLVKVARENRENGIKM